MMTTMPDLAGRRVLVVEDDYFIASEVRRGFESGGAEVLGPVGRVRDALALLARTDQVDGAILDVNLHDTMVFPVAEALRARGIPFVFATGYQRTTIPPQYAGVPCYEKPINLHAISESLFG